MSNMKKMILVGGGTGGHIVPIFEIYEYLKSIDKDLDITVIGAGGEIEQQFFKDNSDYRVIVTGKLKRAFALQNIAEFFKFISGLLSSYSLLRRKPELIFSKGGFVSWPIIFWAKMLNIPYFIHESDIEMGAANRYAAGKSLITFVGFPVANYKKIKAREIQYVGQISSLAKNSSPKMNFGNPKPVVLILGGSQGSKKINEAVWGTLPQILHDYNIIHQTGLAGEDEGGARKDQISDDMKKSYKFFGFLTRSKEKDMMVEAINSADLVVTRAGATTVAEIAYYGKPMILVPYKHAASDHQQKNADLLVRKDAAIVITDDELSSAKLVESINQLFSNKEKRENLGENARKLFPSDGLQVVCNEILDFLKERP